MKRNKKQCDKCNKQITLSNFKKHYESCKGINIDNGIKINEEWKQENGKYKCPYCQKEFVKRGIVSHVMRVHTHKDLWKNSKGWYIYSKKRNFVSWNKGLTKETDERVKKSGETYSKRFKNGEVKGWIGKHHTEETKKQIGDKLSRNNKGGRCKWYEIEKLNGQKFNVQGTWERDFCKVLDVLDEDWIKIGIGDKNHTYQWIDKDGSIHNYAPDFYSPKLKKYFEVKGYWWGEDKEKMEYVLNQHSLNLEIIEKKELKNYLKLIE